MKTHKLAQGSPEWMAHRARYFNASDAPAMMGCSPYKTRTQLLHELHTGLTPEVDAATQRRFDDGHRFEALARPLAEKIIGEELYPVVGSSGKFSASFDGLTMAEDTAFEHKTLNDELRTVLELIEKGKYTQRDLPLQYRVQMEQQCIVAGCNRVLFMASKWSGNSLIEERHCWYESDPELADKIDAGWEQFAADLAAYVPQAEATPTAQGRAPETLPALRIEVTGMVTGSNLDAFKAHALAVFGGINRELTTDAQFADAEKTVKWCADVEERLSAAKQHALSQTASIDELFRTIDDISAEARRVRLDLDKLVKGRKEAIRGEIVAEGVKALAQHIDALNARLGKVYMPISAMGADFAGAIKGKRTVDSLRDAVNTELARAKIAANEVADRLQVNLNYLRDNASEFKQLFPDTGAIIQKAPDDLQTLVKSRIADHKAAEAKREEETRERIRKEEQDKLAREQQERLRAESIKAEEDAQANIKVARETESLPAPLLDQLSAIATELRSDVVSSIDTARAIADAKRKAAPATPPTLKLGQIGERLGFSLTGDFLKNLGFEPAARDKAALLFHESDFPLICMRLVAHIQGVQNKQAA